MISYSDEMLEERAKVDWGARDENNNAWLYILFVLMFYAFAIIVLMIKYIRRYC